VGVMSQDFGDSRMDSLEVFQNLIVPEAQDPISLVLQEVRSALLLLRTKLVLSAIDLHYQSRLMAGEVGDVTAYGNLAPESVPIHLV